MRWSPRGAAFARRRRRDDAHRGRRRRKRRAAHRDRRREHRRPRRGRGRGPTVAAPAHGPTTARRIRVRRAALDVPKLSQYFVAHPNERGWCSAAALAMLMRFHGVAADVPAVARASTTRRTAAPETGRSTPRMRARTACAPPSHTCAGSITSPRSSRPGFRSRSRSRGTKGELAGAALAAQRRPSDRRPRRRSGARLRQRPGAAARRRPLRARARSTRCSAATAASRTWSRRASGPPSSSRSRTSEPKRDERGRPQP